MKAKFRRGIFWAVKESLYSLPPMDSNSFEKRRVKISYGDTKLTKFTTLASCHPFTQQVF